MAIIMGSPKDRELAEPAERTLEEFGVSYQVKVLSAHRTPAQLLEYIREFESSGGRIFICMAGWAAHLAGVVAANTLLPVIGVPLATSALSGVDALYSTVQMPKGVPVATVAVNAAENAALLAVQMLSLGDDGLRERLSAYRTRMAEEVLAANVGE